MFDMVMVFVLFFIGIITHELSHILTHFALFKDFAKVKFNFITFKVIPTKRMIKEQKQLFLGVPIIVGMICISLFMFHYPNEAALALIGYLIACSVDFYNMIKIEVKYNE